MIWLNALMAIAICSPTVNVNICRPIATFMGKRSNPSVVFVGTIVFLLIGFIFFFKRVWQFAGNDWKLKHVCNFFNTTQRTFWTKVDFSVIQSRRPMSYHCNLLNLKTFFYGWFTALHLIILYTNLMLGIFWFVIQKTVIEMG